MENIDQEKKREVVKKPKKGLKSVDYETSKLLSQLREKANKKNFGRPVKESEIIALALRLVTAEHLKELQEITIRDKDRVRAAFEMYRKNNGKTSMDQFLGMLVRGVIKPTSGDFLTVGPLSSRMNGV